MRIGDKVRIKSYSFLIDHSHGIVSKYLKKHAGQIRTIKDISSNNDFVRLEEDLIGFGWHFEMFEEIPVPEHSITCKTNLHATRRRHAKININI